MSDFNKQIIEEFRANRGKVGGHFEGSTLLLLHTTGAKSGKQRINPVMYLNDGGRYVVVASKGGAATNPDWYHNIVANSALSVEVGTQQIQVVAEEASEPERTILYEKMEEKNAAFTEYKSKTSRTIPVVVLTPTP